MQRILAIQIKRIGDLIITVPALRLLRRKRPDAHITLVTAGASGQLAVCIPGIDEHLNYRSWRLNAPLWSTLFADSYDFSLDFNGTDRSVDVAISKLRRKFGDCAGEARKIKTVWGKGYLFSRSEWEC